MAESSKATAAGSHWSSLERL